MDIRRTTSRDPEFQTLICALDADIAGRFGAIPDNFASHNVLDVDTAVIALADGGAVGCGCLRAYEGDLVELKRMYVAPAQRGTGLGRAIVRALEAWARELGYASVILETHNQNVEAVRMYAACGYEVIDSYGMYATEPTSVCMRHRLVT